MKLSGHPSGLATWGPTHHGLLRSTTRSTGLTWSHKIDSRVIGFICFCSFFQDFQVSRVIFGKGLCSTPRLSSTHNFSHMPFSQGNHKALPGTDMASSRHRALWKSTTRKHLELQAFLPGSASSWPQNASAARVAALQTNWKAPCLASGK